MHVFACRMLADTCLRIFICFCEHVEKSKSHVNSSPDTNKNTPFYSELYVLLKWGAVIHTCWHAHTHTHTHTCRDPAPRLPAPSFVNQPDKQKHKVSQVTGSWDPVLLHIPTHCWSPHSDHLTHSINSVSSTHTTLWTRFCCWHADSSWGKHACRSSLNFLSPY